MSSSFVKAENEDAVYRGLVPSPGRMIRHRHMVQSTFVDVRLTRQEWAFLVAATAVFDDQQRVDDEDRADFDELLALLRRHGLLAGWGDER